MAGRALTTLVCCIALATRIGAAHPGYGIVVDDDGAVWFVDLPRETIWRFSEGRLEPMATGLHVHRLTRDAGGRLLVDDQTADSAMSYSWLDADGLEEHVASAPRARRATGHPVVGDFPNGLSMLRDVAGRSYNVVYEQDVEFPRLVRRDPATLDGVDTVIAARVFEIVDGESVPPDLHYFQAMTWSHDGSILLTEGGRVRRLGLDGGIETLGGEPLAGVGGSHPTIPLPDRTLGVAEDVHGRVYVADYGRGAVRRIDPDGAIATVFDSRPGWGPTGVATGGDDLYVLEARRGLLLPLLRYLDGPRVVVVHPDGDTTTLVNVDGHRRFYPWLALLVLASVLAVAVMRRRRNRRGRQERTA